MPMGHRVKSLLGAPVAAFLLLCVGSATVSPPVFNGTVNIPPTGFISGAFLTYTPEQYGSIGNGTADDTVAVQAALTACATTGGYVVMPRSYRITSTVTLPGGAYTCIVRGSGGTGNANPGNNGLYPDAGVGTAFVIASGAPFDVVENLGITHPYQVTTSTFVIPETCNGSNTVKVPIGGQALCFPNGAGLEINDLSGGHNMLGHIV